MKRRAYRVTNPFPPSTSTPTTLSTPRFPPSSELPCGARLYRTGGPSGAAPSPHGTESQSPQPNRPKVLRQPTTQHSTISLSTPLMYSCVRTLGLVSSFGSVLLIFCRKNYNFLLLGLLFLFILRLLYFFFLRSFSPHQ